MGKGGKGKGENKGYAGYRANVHLLLVRDPLIYIISELDDREGDPLGIPRAQFYL